MRMYMCALPPGQLIFYLFTGCSVINTWTTKLFFISLYLSTTDALPQKSHCAWHLIETHKACAESCLMFKKKKRFCLLLYESLSAHIVYAKSKICHWLLWNACAPSCHVSDRFTYMAINTPSPNKIAFRNSNRFFFLYIHASDLLCNVTLLGAGGPGLHRTPFCSLSLSGSV